MRAWLIAAFCACALAAPAFVAQTPAQTKKSKKKTTAKAAPRKAAAPVNVDDYLSVAREYPVENVAALVPFFEQLYRHQRGEIPEGLHILHFGDSHTAADEWTGFLRALFQNRFGDGGSGFTHAGRPWNGFRRLDLKAASTSGWYSDGLPGRVGDGLYGLGGVSMTAMRPGQMVALEVNCDRLEVFYLQQPGGGSLSFTDNGGEAVRISTDGETAPGYFQHKSDSGQHRFELRTLDHAPVRLFGWVAEQGRGITYETLGINGAQAAITFRWEEKLLASHIAKRNPSLIVLAYGTNEASDREWTQESYRDMFAALIYRFRRMAPTATILVIGPPDRYVRGRAGWQVYDKVDRIIEAQREAALGTGCVFWDMRAKMGGKGSMRQWVGSGLAQRDYVHFTAPGYRILGGAVFQDLMEHYGTFVRVRREMIGLGRSQERNGQTSENR